MPARTTTSSRSRAATPLSRTSLSARANSDRKPCSRARLGDIVNIAGWDDPSTEAPAELSEIAEVSRAALRAEAERSGSIPQVADPLEQYGRAQALTFGVDGATSDANNARASAAAWAIAAAAEGEEPFGARLVVDHGGDLAAAVSSPEFANVLQSELGPEDQGPTRSRPRARRSSPTYRSMEPPQPRSGSRRRPRRRWRRQPKSPRAGVPRGRALGAGRAWSPHRPRQDPREAPPRQRGPRRAC
ncbi:hypothetical protein [Clavibacter tessellarius]|uniref:hypothetical protein n=1 Tax=Clavibacter tessellarius TaxID=31965 RepID=UPI00324E3AF0